MTRFLVAALTTALLFCGCDTAPSSQTATEKTINIYNWSDYVAEDTIKNFEAKTGITVIYDVYDSNEMLEAKLMAGASGYDIVFPSARPFAQRHIDAKLYQPLDKSRLPNWSNLNKDILQSLEDVDPDNQHLMPYMWGTTGIGYNVKKIKERLGDSATLDSWSLLFDPSIAEKLKDCGIALLDEEQEVFGAALIYLGRDPNAVGGDEITAVSTLYANIRPFIRYVNSSKYIEDLANGEICIAMGYNGDVLQAQNRALEAKNGQEIAYIIPKEGAVRWIDSAAIPADAPHVDNAHEFINYLLEAPVIAAISDHVSYANANQSATELVSAAIRNNPGIYPAEAITRKFVNLKKLPETENRARARAWTSIKSGQ
jgi:putrescine transport system substrate-binding protein